MKMSTTYSPEGGLIYVDDEPDAIRRKVKRAQTDSGSEVRRGEGKEGVANLIDIFSVARGVAPEEVEKQFEGEGYGAFKGAVAEAVIELLAPIQRRYEEIHADEPELMRMLARGAEKARAASAPTLEAIYERMGFVRPQ